MEHVRQYSVKLRTRSSKEGDNAERLTKEGNNNLTIKKERTETSSITLFLFLIMTRFNESGAFELIYFLFTVYSFMAGYHYAVLVTLRNMNRGFDVQPVLRVLQIFRYA